MIMTVDPGQQLTLPRLQVPAIFLVIEGSGDTLESGYAPPIILRPGRAYYMPPGVDPLTFKVGGAQKGPLKVSRANDEKIKKITHNNKKEQRSARAGVGAGKKVLRVLLLGLRIRLAFCFRACALFLCFSLAHAHAHTPYLSNCLILYRCVFSLDPVPCLRWRLRTKTFTGARSQAKTRP
jgi:hypothetical protein